MGNLGGSGRAGTRPQVSITSGEPIQPHGARDLLRVLRNLQTAQDAVPPGCL